MKRLASTFLAVVAAVLITAATASAGSTDVIMLLLQPWENSTVGEKKIFPINIS